MAELPIARFTGKIEVIDTSEKAEEAIRILLTQDRVGFDTETRPSFQKGRYHKMALMQLSTLEVCYLFRLNIIGIPDSLTAFLSNPHILKVGLSLKDDFSVLRRSIHLVPENFIDLQDFVKDYNIEEAGLQRIYAILFGERIPKSKRLSNWEAESLSESQLMYAAMDAWACLRIYDKLSSIVKNTETEE